MIKGYVGCRVQGCGCASRPKDTLGEQRKKEFHHQHSLKTGKAWVRRPNPVLFGVILRTILVQSGEQYLKLSAQEPFSPRACLEVSQNQGYLVRGPYNKEHNLLWSILLGEAACGSRTACFSCRKTFK